MSASAVVGRREFIRTGAAIGGGLLVSLHAPLPGRTSDALAAEEKDFALNAFVRIGTDESVTVISAHSEMGQGIYTSLPMLLNEELQADWSKIRVEAAPVDKVYNHPVFGIQMTGGSTTSPAEWNRYRKMGAVARTMLVEAAARQWNVEAASCHVDKGVVIHGATGRRATYGSLANAAAQLTAPADVPLKDAKAFTLIGKPTRRLDTPSKTNGTAQFGLDVSVPGMLTAVVARPPVFAGKVAKFDASVRRGRNCGAVLAGEDRAGQTRRRLGPGAKCHSLHRTNVARFYRHGEKPRNYRQKDRRSRGDAENSGEDHYGGCEIWTGTQFETVDRANAAKVAGLPPEKVQMHTTLLGGGFGRRANPASDFVVEAVHVAKAAKAPVKVVWTREDDLKGGWYRPMWHDRFVAGLDASGNPVAWTHTIVGQSIMQGTLFEAYGIKDGVDSASVEGAADLLYGIPNLQVDLHTPKIGVPVQWWRSVGHSHTGFSVEAFLDEVAHAGGKDPYELRRTLLAKQPRMLAVLELAAQKANWGSKLPAGVGRGIATHFSFDSYVAQVVEASVEKNGAVRVHRVVCAVDCGTVINPDTVKAQMEGGIIFGLTAALKTEITLKDGRVQQENFHDYQMLRIFESPEIEVHIVPSSENPTGVGEPGVPPVAPALANAIFAVTGKRIRRLPIRAVDLAREGAKS